MTLTRLNWQVLRLKGDSSHEYARQIDGLQSVLDYGWATRPSETTGNPVYVRPSVLVIYREDHAFLLDAVIPRPDTPDIDYDFILASQPWRARMSAQFKVGKVLLPLMRRLAPGGRLLVIQSRGDDPGLEIVRELWPDEAPFQVDRHRLLGELGSALGADASEILDARPARQRGDFPLRDAYAARRGRRSHRHVDVVRRLECGDLRQPDRG